MLDMTPSIDQVLHSSPSPSPSPSPLSSKFPSSGSPAPNLRQDNVTMSPSRPPPIPHQTVYADRPSSGSPSKFDSSTSTLDATTNNFNNNNTAAADHLPITTLADDDMFHASASSRGGRDGLTDFFSREVFQLVLHNPTTAHRFLKFCQARSCAENIEFLQKVDAYNRLLDEVTRQLTDLHATYTSVEALKQINISYPAVKRITNDVKTTTQSTIPAMETIFAGAQEHVEKLLATDIYPRFVKHQITTSATVALSDNRARFQGLGDCFCLTDPSIADNPITYASDGFIEVTGYTRKDIVPRNCRFLQGPLTDKISVNRLRASIDNAEETVELLLNYRKNGDPFWNLLYVSPLFDEAGNIAFYLGGQINCSTTIHSCTDILKILSLNDEGVTERVGDSDACSMRPPSGRGQANSLSTSSRSSFFKSLRRPNVSALRGSARLTVREETGMEGELIDKIGKMDFRTQVEAFYTAYSKYLVLRYKSSSTDLNVSYFSPGVIDMLCLNLPNGQIAPIFHRDVFQVLAEHSMSSSAHKALKSTVKSSLKRGNAVSIEVTLLTGVEVKRGGFGGLGAKVTTRSEERYVSHWTPLKDEEGRVCWVVLTISPR